jgi:collagenase-like PrtC family protease
VSPNGRFSEHEQITDFETLKVIVQEVHKYNLEVFINLNAWYYTDKTMPLIKQMIQEFQSIDIDGIIC